MCLDPRPDRVRRIRSIRRSTPLPRLLGATLPSSSTLVVRGPALRALERLAGEDDLEARGWVVLSRQA